MRRLGKQDSVKLKKGRENEACPAELFVLGRNREAER